MLKNDRFGIVKHEVMSDPDLSPQAKGLYALLCCYANKNRQCFPTKARLADEMDVSFDSIKRYFRELKRKKYLKRDGMIITIK